MFLTKKPKLITRLKSSQGQPCGPGQNPGRDGCRAADGTSSSGSSDSSNDSDKKIEIKKPETIDEFNEFTSEFIEELDERFYDTFEENPIATVSSDDMQEMSHSDFVSLIDDAKDNLKIGLLSLRSDFMDLLDLEEDHHKNLLKEVDDGIKDTLSFFQKQTDKLTKLHEKKYEKQQIWENLADNEPPYTYDENHPDWVPPPEEPNAPDYHDIEEPIEPDIQDYTVYSGDEVDSIEQEQFDADMAQYEIDRKKYDEAEKAYEDAYAQYEQDYDKWHDEFTEWEDTLEKREIKAADDYEAWEKKKDKAEKDYDKAFEKADEFHTNLLEGLQEKQNDLNENLLSDFAREVQTYYEDLIEERDNQDDDEETDDEIEKQFQKGDASGQPCKPGQNPGRDGCTLTGGKPGKKPDKKPADDKKTLPENKYYDISKWNPTNSAAVSNANKMAKMQAAAENGDWDLVEKLKPKPKGKMNTYQKKALDVYEQILAEKLAKEMQGDPLDENDMMPVDDSPVETEVFNTEEEIVQNNVEQYEQAQNKSESVKDTYNNSFEDPYIKYKHDNLDTLKGKFPSFVLSDLSELMHNFGKHVSANLLDEDDYAVSFLNWYKGFQTPDVDSLIDYLVNADDENPLSGKDSEWNEIKGFNANEPIKNNIIDKLQIPGMEDIPNSANYVEQFADYAQSKNLLSPDADPIAIQQMFRSFLVGNLVQQVDDTEKQYVLELAKGIKDGNPEWTDKYGKLLLSLNSKGQIPKGLYLSASDYVFDTISKGNDISVDDWKNYMLSNLDYVSESTKSDFLDTLDYLQGGKEDWEDYAKEMEKQALENSFDEVQEVEPEPQKPYDQKKIENMDGWKKIGNQKGGNEGGQYVAPDGTNYYVKNAPSENHAMNEKLANELYKLAGVVVPEVSLIETGKGLGIASKWMEHSTETFSPSSEKHKEAASENFGVHVWLNNWDAIGANFDNQTWVKNADGSESLVTIDAGGSLMFSALGKPKMFTGDIVAEWDNMLDSSINPNASKVFGGMTLDQQYNSLQKLANISDSAIDSIVDAMNMDGAIATVLKDTLKKRQKLLLDKAKEIKKAMDGSGPAPAAFAAPQFPLDTSLPAYDYYKGQFQEALQEIIDTGSNTQMEKLSNMTNKSYGDFFKKMNAFVVSKDPKTFQGGSFSDFGVDNFFDTQKAEKLKLQDSDFEGLPHFQSSKLSQVAENVKACKELLELAKQGKLTDLNYMKVPPSPKVEQYKQTLISQLTDYLNPPMKPVSFSGQLSELKNAYKNVSEAAKANAKKIGNYLVTDYIQPTSKVEVNLDNKLEFSKYQRYGLTLTDYNELENTELHENNKKAFESFTQKTKMTLKNYTGGGYFEINEMFRSALDESSLKPSVQAKYNEFKQVAKEFMQKSPEIPAGTYFRRTIELSPSISKNIKPGHILQEPGFSSVTIMPNDFTTGKLDKVRFEMETMPGVKGLYAEDFTVNESEYEYILPPGTRYYIGDVFEDTDGVTVIKAKILPTIDEQCC